MSTKTVTIAAAELSDLKENTTELAKALRQIEDLKEQNRRLEQQARSTATLSNIVEVADAAYRLYNAEALEMPAGGHEMAPSGMEPEVKEHRNFRDCFERILDGFDRALNGFTTSKGRQFNGLVGNEEYWRKKLAVLKAEGDQLFLTSGQPTKGARYYYERWIEVSELLHLVQEARQFFAQAYDAVTVDTEYKPFDARMAELGARREKDEAAAAKTAEALADLLKNAPSLGKLIGRV